MESEIALLFKQIYFKILFIFTWKADLQETEQDLLFTGSQ